VPKTIVDVTTVTSTLAIAESGEVLDVNVGLTLTHTYDGDIDIYLVGPDGTVVELLGEVKTEVGIEWQRVRDPKAREGWVASQYLIINP